MLATSLCRTTVTKAPPVRFCNLAIFLHRDAFFFSSFTFVSPFLFMFGRFLLAMFYALAIPSHKRLFIYLYCPFTSHCSHPLFKRRFNVLISLFVRRACRSVLSIQTSLKIIDCLIRTSTGRPVLSIQTSLKLIDCLIQTSTARSVLSIQTFLKIIDCLIQTSTTRSVLFIQTSLDLDASIDWLRHRSFSIEMQKSIDYVIVLLKRPHRLVYYSYTAQVKVGYMGRVFFLFWFVLFVCGGVWVCVCVCVCVFLFLLLLLLLFFFLVIFCFCVCFFCFDSFCLLFEAWESWKQNVS